MSYNTIYQCANDQALRDRVTACSAQEGSPQPELTMSQVIWPLSCASDIEAAYAFAINSSNPDPGGDETVITDAMILGQVQANWPTTTLPPNGGPSGPI